MAALTLDTLPALDELTHMALDELAGELSQQTDWTKPGAWDYSMTKADKYQALVAELTPVTEVAGPLDEETSAPEESIEQTITGAIQIINEAFVLHLIDNGTKYELRRLSGVDDRFVFTADEYDRIKALFA